MVLYLRGGLCPRIALLCNRRASRPCPSAMASSVVASENRICETRAKFKNL